MGDNVWVVRERITSLPKGSDMTTDQKFKALVDFMAPSKSGELTDSQHRYIVTYGDGFGKMTGQQLDELGVTFDWSHVRDSSDAAIDEMYSALGRVISNMVVFEDQNIEWDQSERDAWSR